MLYPYPGNAVFNFSQMDLLNSFMSLKRSINLIDVPHLATHVVSGNTRHVIAHNPFATPIYVVRPDV